MLIKHVLKEYIKILSVTRRVKGFRGDFFNWLFIKPIQYLFMEFTLALESILLPFLGRIEVKSPVFLIGHPRSGTTFLHRLITQTDEFTVFRAWEMVFPTLIGRFIAYPFIQVICWIKKDTVFPKDVGHELKMKSIEEEELLFLQNLDTQLLTLASLIGFHKNEYKELVYLDEQEHELASVKKFKRFLQRQLFLKGRHKRVVTKMNYSLFRVKTLQKVFPDARFVYIHRDPMDCMRSHLSLHYSMLNHTWGIESFSADDIQRFFTRRINYNIAFFKYFLQLKAEGVLNQTNTIEIQFSEIKTQLAPTLDKVFDFLKLTPSPQLKTALINESQKQSQYRRTHHHVPLEKFGISEEELKSSIGAVFKPSTHQTVL